MSETVRNPFQFGVVVKQLSFCNRVAELADLKRAFANGDRLFLYSERRLGKTSLIKRAFQDMPEADYLCVYVDLWPTSNESEFALKLAKAIAEKTATTAQAMLETAKKFFGAFRPSITLDDEGKPQVVFGATQGAANENFELEEVLNTLPGIGKQLKKKIVVAFDEFQQITEYSSPDAERRLRSCVQNLDDISFIFLGSKKHLLEKMFVDKQRPLYRAAAHYPLKPIISTEWLPFIVSKFENSGKKISEDLVLTICAFTGGHPFYTQHICHEIWEITNGSVSETALAEACENLLAQEGFAFTTLWDSLSLNQRTFLTTIAEVETETELFSAEFVKRSGLKSASNVQRVKESLLNKDIVDIDQTGAIYISDRFFRMWIQRRIINSKQ